MRGGFHLTPPTSVYGLSPLPPCKHILQTAFKVIHETANFVQLASADEITVMCEHTRNSTTSTCNNISYWRGKNIRFNTARALITRRNNVQHWYLISRDCREIITVGASIVRGFNFEASFSTQRRHTRYFRALCTHSTSPQLTFKILQPSGRWKKKCFWIVDQHTSSETNCSSARCQSSDSICSSSFWNLSAASG